MVTADKVSRVWNAVNGFSLPRLESDVHGEVDCGLATFDDCMVRCLLKSTYGIKSNLQYFSAANFLLSLFTAFQLYVARLLIIRLKLRNISMQFLIHQFFEGHFKSPPRPF